MKALLRIFRPSRKLVLVIGGIALLAGGSGAAALYVGKDKILGPSAQETSGLECTDVNLVTIRKLNRFWIRKYIKTEPTDGMTRVKTALRVAQAVYASQKPDLVQVVVLDEHGPTLRSDIRGRAIGADVIYIPDPTKVTEEPNSPLFSAKYYDGSANDTGLFYGEKIELPLPDIEKLSSSFKEHDDCKDPLVADASAEEGTKKGHDKAKSSEGEAKPEGEGSAPAEHGAPSGEAAPAEEGQPAAEHSGSGGETSDAAPAEEPPPANASTHGEAPAG